MIEFLPLLLTIAATLAAIQLVLVWSKCWASDLLVANEILDEHYKAANALIQDEKTPDSVVRFVGFASQQAAHPALARRFASHVITGRLRNPRPHGPEAVKFAADLNSLSPEGRKQFASFLSTAMISSAASDPIFSRVYLMVASAFLSTSGRADDRTVSAERAETAAVDLSDNLFACA